MDLLSQKGLQVEKRVLREPYFSCSIICQWQVQGSRVLLGGSWGLVSTVLGTLTGVITNYKCSYLVYNCKY